MSKEFIKEIEVKRAKQILEFLEEAVTEEDKEVYVIEIIQIKYRVKNKERILVEKNSLFYLAMDEYEKEQKLCWLSSYEPNLYKVSKNNLRAETKTCQG